MKNFEKKNKDTNEKHPKIREKKISSTHTPTVFLSPVRQKSVQNIIYYSLVTFNFIWPKTTAKKKRNVLITVKIFYLFPLHNWCDHFYFLSLCWCSENRKWNCDYLKIYKVFFFVLYFENRWKWKSDDEIRFLIFTFGFFV